MNDRVLHSIPSISSRDGGPATVVRELFRLGQASDMHLHLVTTDKGLERYDVLPPRTTLCASRPPHRITFSPSFSRTYASSLEHSDLAHVHSVSNYPTAVASRHLRRGEVPYVLQPHGALSLPRAVTQRSASRIWAATMERDLVRGAAAVIVSSQREEDGVRALHPDAAIAHLPLGVDDSLFSSPRKPDEERFILYIGRLAKVKGIDLLVSAMDQPPLKELNVRLVLAGPVHYDLPKALAKQLADVGRSGRIAVLGSIGAEERRRLLSECSVFVLPSRGESFGIAAAEAMAAGTPTILSAEVGLATDASRAQATTITDLDPLALAGHLRDLLDSPEAAEALGSKGRNYASANFRWATMWTRYQALCQSIISVHPRG